MSSISHQKQQELWDKEHQKPTVLLQMDSSDASYGVRKFADWLIDKVKDLRNLEGIEICCGKGRNVIWFAKQGANMIGADFSAAAIKEAERRAKKDRISNRSSFIVHDVTLPYPIEDKSLDFAFDCFGSTDIESTEGRKAALDNLIRILKPHGYLMIYLLSSDDEFHKEMAKKYPGPDAGSFIHPVNGKYEKFFTEDEVKQFYGKLNLVAIERIPKKEIFFGKEYKCNHIWAVFQKPSRI